MANKRKPGYRPKSREQARGWNYKKITLYFIALLFIIAIIWLVPYLGRDSRETEIAEPEETPLFRKDSELSFYDQEENLVTTIDIEIADTIPSRTEGLMFRPAMEQNRGMLFIFDRTHNIEMWMRNTYIPLDMIFVRIDRTIAHIETATVPFTDDPIASPEPVLYVIEVNAGFVERYGIREGYRVDWY
jgi:hypothetical protein